MAGDAWSGCGVVQDMGPGRYLSCVALPCFTNRAVRSLASCSPYTQLEDASVVSHCPVSGWV